MIKQPEYDAIRPNRVISPQQADGRRGQDAAAVEPAYPALLAPQRRREKLYQDTVFINA